MIDQGMCVPAYCDGTEEQKAYIARCKRDVFTDMKLAIDALKVFNDALKLLHPVCESKIRCLL